MATTTHPAEPDTTLQTVTVRYKPAPAAQRALAKLLAAVRGRIDFHPGLAHIRLLSATTAPAVAALLTDLERAAVVADGSIAARGVGCQPPAQDCGNTTANGAIQ